MSINSRYCLKSFFFIGLITSAVFLMIELFFAEQLKTFLENYNAPSDFVLTLVILIGYLISAFISVVSSYVGIEYIGEKKRVYISTSLAILVNFFLWTILSYIFVLKNYPGIISDLSGIEKIVIFPKMIRNFAVYVLPNLTLLWLLAGWTHSLIFIFLLNAFGIQIYYKDTDPKGTIW